MKKFNSAVSNEPLTYATNRVIKVNDDNSPIILNTAQWIRQTKPKLPPFFSEDYTYIVDIQYRQYLKDSQLRIEQYQHDILLTDSETKKNAFFSKIVVTLQTTPFKHDIKLVLKTSDGDEVSLCALKNIDPTVNAFQYFVDQQVDFAAALHEQIPNFCLPSGQQLILRISGGVILNESILVCVNYV